MQLLLDVLDILRLPKEPGYPQVCLADVRRRAVLFHQREDRNTRCVTDVVQRLTEFYARHFRHVEVDDDAVRLVFYSESHSLFGGGRSMNIKISGEPCANAVSDVIVADYEEFLHEVGEALLAS